MRGAPRAPRAARRALAGAGVLATLAIGLPAAAAPTDSEDPQLDADVVSAPAPVVEPGDAMNVTVAVSNLSTTAVDDARVILQITRKPLENRKALAAFLDGGDARLVSVGGTDVGVTMTEPTPSPVPTPDATQGPDGAAEPEQPDTFTRLAAGTSSTVTVTSVDDRLPFEADTWGVHGIRVVLRADGETTTLMNGAVTWDDADIPALSLATLATATGITDRVDAVAEAAGLDGVTLAVDGNAWSALDGGSADIDEGSTLRLPAQDPDLVSLAHAESTEVLDYSLGLSSGAGDGELAGLPWLGIVGSLDKATVRYAVENGAGTLLVTPDADDAPDTRPVSATRLVGAGEWRMTLLQPDPLLSELAMADASSTPGAAGMATAAAALTAAQHDGPVLVWTGDDWSPTTASATTTLSALLSASFVSAVSVGDLLDAPADRGASLEELLGEEDDLGKAAITGIATRLERLADLGVVAEDPEDITVPGGAALLAPLARTVRGDELARELLLTDAQTTVDATLGALHVAAGSDINFIADQGALPVTVVNDLDVAATVVVDMTSFSANLQIRDSPTVTVPPRSSTTVPVEVSAVSSANVQARTVLRNTDGRSIASPVSMSVRVRADWGTAVTAVFTVGLIAMLVMGVIRTVRRGRKDTRTDHAGTGERG